MGDILIGICAGAAAVGAYAHFQPVPEAVVIILVAVTIGLGLLRQSPNPPWGP